MNLTYRRLRRAVMIGSATTVLGCASPALAQPIGEHGYDVAPQSLASALREVAKQSGLELIIRGDLVKGRRTGALKGSFTPEQALATLLSGSGLVADVSDGIVTIRGRTTPPGEALSGPGDRADIVVTGSRIRGAPSSSPVIALSQKDMLLQGKTNLGEAIRSLPQNFSGGQNPGVGIGNFGSNTTNFNGTSSLNLRGLGADASLTLLNGHRLAYDGALQSVDISAIPLAAVDRIEVVADGASALYGSDAVGGVANVILKRDFEGAALSARFGAATDGGDVQQQYSLVFGHKWATGGFIAAYSYEHDTPILARQRSYARGLFGEADLLRSQSIHNALFSGHQELAAGVEIALDAVYSRRATGGNIPYTTTNDVLFSGQIDRTKAQSYSLAPSLKVGLGSNWIANLVGTYAKDKTRAHSDYYSGGDIFFVYGGCNCNALRSAELNAEGPLFDLPGGSARLAVGGGYRWIGYAVSDLVSRIYSASRDSYYGYGELFLPFVGRDQQIPFVDRLSVSAALRYENYPGMDKVVTPKIGLIYAPSADLDIKASWGKSFKAPTLVQEYFPQFAYVYPTSEVGGAGLPAASTVLYLEGGNTRLKPERATTWSATLVLHPRPLPGLQIEASYFDIRYRDRVVQPIVSTSGILSNPIYQDLIAYDPSDAQIDEAIGRAASGLSNPFGIVYDRNDVIAIVDNRNLNVAEQRLHGIDLLARYRHDLGNGGSLTFTANGSYLHSRQRLSAGQPAIPLAGTIFNPPHFRGRTGLVLDNRSIVLASYLSYVGGVTDNRSATIRHVGAMTTLDLTAQLRLDRAAGIFRDIDLTLSAQNILNDKPSVIFNSVAYRTPYDSTNYSPVGRFVSLTISKRI
ncbi:TonB-dependent receptor [Flavisphingomonas formosensis]|uniref:TonB-dependent receptor n=1 Tax=Flavisphingomonas formosensis TaxID=861534 RepID=UPI001E5BB056|nr:TonB-dependent receptor [Sphingomonas formosensis]